MEDVSGELRSLFLTVQARHEIISRSWTNRRKNFFKQSIMKLWSSLPQEVMEAESINELKMWLGKFMDSPPSQAVKQGCGFNIWLRKSFSKDCRKSARIYWGGRAEDFQSLWKGSFLLLIFPWAHSLNSWNWFVSDTGSWTVIFFLAHYDSSKSFLYFISPFPLPALSFYIQAIGWAKSLSSTAAVPPDFTTLFDLWVCWTVYLCLVFMLSTWKKQGGFSINSWLHES